MSSWNTQMMFDRYLYNYFIKKNLHLTAEIFREEANVSLDPSIPHSIDVPDGFLYEWWSIFYEMYKARESMDHHVPGEGQNTMVEQMMGTRQPIDPFQPYPMNQQGISRVLTDADSWFNTDINAMGSRSEHLRGAERFPQVISPSSHQHSLLEPKSVQYLPGHPANLPGQVGCSVPAASRKRKGIASEVEDELIIPPPEFEKYLFNSLWLTEKHQQELRDNSLLAQGSGAKSVNTTEAIDGNCCGSCDKETTSDASLKCNSNDDNVSPSSPHATRNKDNADSSSSMVSISATTADDLKVHQVVESEKDGVVESKKEGWDIIRGIHVNCNFDNSIREIFRKCSFLELRS